MDHFRELKTETKDQNSSQQQRPSTSEQLLANNRVAGPAGSGEQKQVEQQQQQQQRRPLEGSSSLSNTQLRNARKEISKLPATSLDDKSGSLSGSFDSHEGATGSKLSCKRQGSQRSAQEEGEENNEALVLLEKQSKTAPAVAEAAKRFPRRPSSASDCCYCSSTRQRQQQQQQQHSTTETTTLPSASMSAGDSKRLIWAYFLAEMVGTFLLVVIGDGAIAAYVVTKRELDLFGACLAFGVGAMAATFAAAKISGAHINPAASLAFALDGRLRWSLLPVYMLAQYLGAFLAALVLYVNYFEAINALDGGQRVAFNTANGNNNSTGQIFATYPGQWTTEWGALLDQIIGTAVLLFSLSALTDKNNSSLEDRHQPVVVALLIGLICVAFSPNCGAIFNPARDLAPRVLTSLVGYPSVWAPIRGRYWLMAGLVGPHVGAILGVFGYKLLIGRSLDLKRNYELEAMEMDYSGSGEHNNSNNNNHKQNQSYSAGCKVGQIHHHNHQSNSLQQQQPQQHLHQANYGAAMR